MIIVESGGKQYGDISITTDTEILYFPPAEGFFKIIHPEARVRDSNGSIHVKKAQFYFTISYNHGEWFVRVDSFRSYHCKYFSPEYDLKNKSWIITHKDSNVYHHG